MKKINILLVAASLLVGTLVSCGDETPKEPEVPQIPEKPEEPETPTPEPVKKVDYKKYNIEELTLEDKLEGLDEEANVKVETKQIILPKGHQKVSLPDLDLPYFLLTLVNEDGYLGLYNVIAEKYIYAPQIDISKEEKLVSPFEVYSFGDEYLIKINEGDTTLFIDYIGNLIHECKTKDVKDVSFEIKRETYKEGRENISYLKVGDTTIRYIYEGGTPKFLGPVTLFFDNANEIIPLDKEGYPGYSYFVNQDDYVKIYKDDELINEYPLKINLNYDEGESAGGKFVYTTLQELSATNFDYSYRVFDEGEVEAHIKEDVYQIDILTGEQKKLSFDPNYSISYISAIKNDEGIFDAFIVEAYKVDNKVLNEEVLKLFVCDLDLNIIEDVTNAKEFRCVKIGDLYIDKMTDIIYDKDFNLIDFNTNSYFRNYIFNKDLVVLQNDITDYLGLYKSNGEEVLPQDYIEIIINEHSDVAILLNKNRLCTVVSLDTLEVLKGPYEFDEYELDDYAIASNVTLMKATEYFPKITVITGNGEVTELVNFDDLRIPIGDPIADSRFTGICILYVPIINEGLVLSRIYLEDVEVKTVGKEKVRYEYDGTNAYQALPLVVGENTVIKTNEEPIERRTLTYTPKKSGFYDLTALGPYFHSVYLVSNNEVVDCGDNLLDKTIYLEKDCRYFFDIDITENATFKFAFVRDVEVYDGTKLENLFVTEAKNSYFVFECHETGSYYFEAENGELIDINNLTDGALMSAIANDDHIDGQQRIILYEGFTYFLTVEALEDKKPSILYSNILDFDLENYLLYDEKLVTKNEDGSYTYVQKEDNPEELFYCELPMGGLFYVEFDVSVNAPNGEFGLDFPDGTITIEGRQVKHVKTLVYDGFVLYFDCPNNDYFDVGFTISNFKMSDPILLFI